MTVCDCDMSEVLNQIIISAEDMLKQPYTWKRASKSKDNASEAPLETKIDPARLLSWFEWIWLKYMNFITAKLQSQNLFLLVPPDTHESIVCLLRENCFVSVKDYVIGGRSKAAHCHVSDCTDDVVSQQDIITPSKSQKKTVKQRLSNHFAAAKEALVTCIWGTKDVKIICSSCKELLDSIPFNYSRGQVVLCPK